MLSGDTDKEAAKAERSRAAVTKQTTGRTQDGLPVHSFRTLLADLATLTRNTLAYRHRPQPTLHSYCASDAPSTRGP
jgi:hypothetical protein